MRDLLRVALLSQSTSLYFFSDNKNQPVYSSCASAPGHPVLFVPPPPNHPPNDDLPTFTMPGNNRTIYANTSKAFNERTSGPTFVLPSKRFSNHEYTRLTINIIVMSFLIHSSLLCTPLSYLYHTLYIKVQDRMQM